MAMINATEAVCWANAAESTRTRAAFKWARIDPKWAAGRSPDEIQRDGWRHRLKPGGEWYRVRVTSDTGKPLLEKIPQSAQYGTPLTGLTNASLRLFVKVLNKYGDEANVRITQGAGHDVNADNSYERYMLGIKGRGEGWIVSGSCPVVSALNGDLQPHLVVSQSVRDAIEHAQACPHSRLGMKNPPCPHYEAEQDARWARRDEDYQRMIDNAKSEEAKLLEGQVAVQQRTSEALVQVVEKMAGTVREIQEERATAPAKGDKK